MRVLHHNIVDAGHNEAVVRMRLRFANDELRLKSVNAKVEMFGRNRTSPSALSRSWPTYCIRISHYYQVSLNGFMANTQTIELDSWHRNTSVSPKRMLPSDYNDQMRNLSIHTYMIYAHIGVKIGQFEVQRRVDQVVTRCCDAIYSDWL